MTLMPRHSAIALPALQEKGYREDKAARWRFERPYCYFSIPGLALFLGSVLTPNLLSHELSQPWITVDVGLGLIGFALISVPSWRILHVVPINPQTLNRLDIYERSDTRTKAGFLEWIYVDHDTKTYFVRPARLGYGD